MSRLFDTTDYRRFIVMALEGRGMTQRDLAEAIGRTRGAISMIISGIRSLDPALVEPIARALRLDPEEATYFAALVDVESQSARARAAAWGTIQATQRHRAEQERSSRFTEAAGKWYLVVLLELASCEGFRADARWIAANLVPPITVDEAQEALSLAVALKLLVPNEDGRLVPSAPDEWGPNDIADPRDSRAAAERFRAGLQLAAGCLTRSLHNERHVSTTTFRLSEEQFGRIRARIREMEREIIVMASDASEPSNRVYQFQVQLFPVSEYTDSTADHSTIDNNQGEPPDIDPDTTE